MKSISSKRNGNERMEQLIMGYLNYKSLSRRREISQYLRIIMMEKLNRGGKRNNSNTALTEYRMGNFIKLLLFS